MGSSAFVDVPVGYKAGEDYSVRGGFREERRLGFGNKA